MVVPTHLHRRAQQCVVTVLIHASWFAVPVAVEMVSFASGGVLRRLAQLVAQCSIGLVPHVGVAEVLLHTLQQGICFTSRWGEGGGSRRLSPCSARSFVPVYDNSQQPHIVWVLHPPTLSKALAYCTGACVMSKRVGRYLGDISNGAVVCQVYLLTQCLVLQRIQIYACKHTQLPYRWLLGTR